MSKIAVIVGSIRRDSINRRLAGALTKLAEPQSRVHDRSRSTSCRCSTRTWSRARRQRWAA